MQDFHVHEGDIAVLPIILASSSAYRRALLEKLALPFSWDNPDIDETALPDETVSALVERLACAKAQALAARYPQHLIIGSDQVAALNGRILGKPGNFENALTQLRACNGQRVEFFTGLCLLNSSDNTSECSVESFSVFFRQLSDAQLSNYLMKEQPFDCAGSFKAEGLGIALFERMEGDDPNTLIGLPLVRLVKLLEAVGVDVI